ncbi:MAG: HEXXH motif-containing putative peptide modification protein [Pseudonocardiaceae bacterium]
MTTPAGPIQCDIPALHAEIATSSSLKRERRALYQFAAELLRGDCPHVLDVLDPDVIDSPLARNSIGDALGGRTTLPSAQLVGISAVAGMGGCSQDLPVASRPEANNLLAGALNIVGAELRRQQAAFAPPELLTEADGESFTSALAVVREGVALARLVSPELTDDLLAHVALVGVIAPRRADQLISASPRAFPGLILLKNPRSNIEVAEALVHEGAHQKLFDLAITHDLLNADSDRCSPFHPPWAPMERLWPLEQALAAWHAYSCLACFGHDAEVRTAAHAIGAGSLLPVASERSKILGQWLLDKGDYLGTDAHMLLGGLIGRRPHTTRTTGSYSSAVAVDYVVNTPLKFRHCGSPDRVLVGRPLQPPQLYWLSNDAAVLLELLGKKSFDEAIPTFAQRWRIQRLDAAHRLIALLADLIASGLVITRATAALAP